MVRIFWVSAHGPLARHVNLRVVHAPGMPGMFSPPPWFSDPDMHNSKCVTHVPWCMPGSLIGGFLWNWRGERFPTFPVHAQPAILRYDMIWYMIWYDMIWCYAMMLCYDVLYICHDVLWDAMVWYGVQCYGMLCYAMRYDMIWCGMVWYGIWCDMIYDMIRYDVVW